MKRAFSFLSLVAITALAGGCSKPIEVVHAPPPSPPEPVAKAPPADPLGPRPEPGPSKPFEPPVPTTFDGPGGSKVWLLERHSLPLVAISIALPYGAASDPKTKPGLAYITSKMLEEGAGKRDGLAFAAAFDDLGASFYAYSNKDMTGLGTLVAQKDLSKALGLLGDALVKPRHRLADFKRRKQLWINDIQRRGDNPKVIARNVTARVLFGKKHPYGRPTIGTEKAAKRIFLGDIKAFHKSHYRPEGATIVVVGDTTKAELQSKLKAAFGKWKGDGKAPAIKQPSFPSKAGVRTFVVHRPKASQVVLSVASKGAAASAETYPDLGLLNIALGGSFTSRLNQNLREDHAWTYGARSRFNLQRGEGAFVMRSSIVNKAIGPALEETLKELRGYQKSGPTSAEVRKMKAQVQSDAMGAYGRIGAIAQSLAISAGHGLPSDDDSKTLRKQLAADEKSLVALAQKSIPSDAMVVVLVGPKALCEKAIAANKLPSPKIVDP